MIGTHIDNGAILPIIEKHGGTIVQLFAENSPNIFGQNLEHIGNFKCIVHASYAINLAKNWTDYSPWIIQLIEEIEIASKIDAKAIVIHLGKQLDLSKEEAYNNMYTSLLYVASQTINFKNVRLLLETSSGQGSEMCYKLEDLSHFYKKISKNPNKKLIDRFGICIDTCHIFAAGYNIINKEMIDIYLESFEELIGLRHVYLIHLNDSKKEVGSNVDRHENIGNGKIGKVGLLYFAKYFKNLNIPIILETPYEHILDDLQLIK